MNAIKRLLAEGDEVVPVMVPAAATLEKQRKRLEQEPPKLAADKPKEEPKEEPKKPTLTKESLATGLLELGEQVKADPELAKYANALAKLAESVSSLALFSYNAEIVATTKTETEVVVRPTPPERDPVLTSLLGRKPPVEDRPPLQQVQARQAEEALKVADGEPKTVLVESAAFAQASAMLNLGAAPSFAMNQPAGQSDGAFRAFARFAPKSKS